MVGAAQKISVSLYPEPHFEIINDAIKNGSFNNPSQFIQTLIVDYGNKKGNHLADFLLYLLYPFLIILLLLVYSRAIENIPLSIIGGILSSIFFYSVYRWTLKIRGIDPSIHWTEKKRKRARIIVFALLVIILVVTIILIALAWSGNPILDLLGM